MSYSGGSEARFTRHHDNPEADQETKLFQALNGFIAMVSNHGDGKPSNASGGCKRVANFLRFNLLSYLRHWQQEVHRAMPHREVLIQWWVTLLNFLNSELIVNARNTEPEKVQGRSFSDPIWNNDTVSVSLECISRIMSTLIVLPIHHYRETEIYSHHILLTIHCVTNQIIFNSKHIRLLGNDQSAINKRFLHFLKNYSTLLRAFLGKLNAYAFFYLPDDFHYDTQLLLSICPQLTFQESSCQSLFSWKRRKFETTDDASQKVDIDHLENRDTRFFKIVISYMKNESIFVAFYWHYWYIVLRFISSIENFENLEGNLDMIPGSSVLLIHATSTTLQNDLNKFGKFLKISNSKGAHPINGINTITDTMPESTTSASSSDNILTSEMLNDFVFTNFGIIRLWECLRSLSGCFSDSSQALNLFALHDSFQLQYISTISAYDCNVANVIYNKLLQFIVFQFKSTKPIHFLNWKKWYTGLISLLQTLNANCQTTALLCLFNIWEHLPLESQKDLALRLLKDQWAALTVDSDFHLVKVIFLKFLVFRILPDPNLDLNDDVKVKLQMLYGEMMSIKAKFDQVPNIGTQDVLAFYGNKKFFLLANKCNSEELLLHKVETQTKMRSKARYRYFPSVSSIANVRPSVVLKNGKYPYDVFDEMVVKATLLLSEKKRRKAELPLPESPLTSKGNHSSSSFETISESPSSGSTKQLSISGTIGSWLTKLSPKGNQQSSNVDRKSNQSCESPTNVDEQKNIRTRRGKSISSDTSLTHSESTEVLSMYSNISSLATRNNSIDELPENSNSGNVSRLLSTASNSEKLGSNASSNDERDKSKPAKAKKKLLAPVELKYSLPVVESWKVTNLFKPIIIPCDSIAKRIDTANTIWSVTTARSYDKPLPIPNSDELDSVIEDLNYDQFGLGSTDVIDYEIENSQARVSMQSSNTEDPLIPIPRYDILGDLSESTDEHLINNSEVLQKFQKFSLNNEQSNQCEFVSLGDDHVSPNYEVHSNRSELMRLRTRLNKIALLIKMFNNTVEEYYEFLNFLDHESLFMDFEVRPPAYSTAAVINS